MSVTSFLASATNFFLAANSGLSDPILNFTPDEPLSKRRGFRERFGDQMVSLRINNAAQRTQTTNKGSGTKCETKSREAEEASGDGPADG
jgi:hypothetical protein